MTILVVVQLQDKAMDINTNSKQLQTGQICSKILIVGDDNIKVLIRLLNYDCLQVASHARASYTRSENEEIISSLKQHINDIKVCIKKI